MRSFTIPYASKKWKEPSVFKDKLENRLQQILPDIDKDDNESVRLKEEYANIKSELQHIANQEAKDTIIRSKARWIEEGEKNKIS